MLTANAGRCLEFIIASASSSVSTCFNSFRRFESCTTSHFSARTYATVHRHIAPASGCSSSTPTDSSCFMCEMHCRIVSLARFPRPDHTPVTSTNRSYDEFVRNTNSRASANEVRSNGAVGISSDGARSYTGTTLLSYAHTAVAIAPTVNSDCVSCWNTDDAKRAKMCRLYREVDRCSFQRLNVKSSSCLGVLYASTFVPLVLGVMMTSPSRLRVC
mmetsp:Transcript_985/g.2959  ORF Transcript_985/g.2959 Transcript_985/m.2959 type:complete len:216 (-) Transcript_985:1089-1736(-)